LKKSLDSLRKLIEGIFFRGSLIRPCRLALRRSRTTRVSKEGDLTEPFNKTSPFTKEKFVDFPIHCNCGRLAALRAGFMPDASATVRTRVWVNRDKGIKMPLSINKTILFIVR